MRAHEELMDILADVVASASLGEAAVARRQAGKLAKVSERLRHYADHIDRLAVELIDQAEKRAA